RRIGCARPRRPAPDRLLRTIIVVGGLTARLTGCAVDRLLLGWPPSGSAGGLALGRGRAAGPLQPVVRAPGAGRVLEPVPGRGHPVELALADAYQRAGLGAGPGERLLHAEASQPVREVAYGFVVVEVGLAHPPLRARAAHHERTVRFLLH